MKVLEGRLVKNITLDRDAGNPKERFISIRQYTEEICQPLKIEDFVVEPAADIRSPKWHLAHTTWYFEQFFLSEYYRNYNFYHPKYAILFNEGDGIQRMNAGNFSRPTVQEIMDYRKFIDVKVQQVLEDLSDRGMPAIEAAFSHEQQHQELIFTCIKYILGQNPLFPVYKESFCETLGPESDFGFANIPEGEYSMGYNGYGFSYENEQTVHHVILRPFQIRKSLVTNEEYLEFILAGGYQRPEYWLVDGWQWLKEKQIEAPLYWYNIENVWHRYALSGLEKLDGGEPVTHVSFYEAAAFANWKGMRLPTEFEWEAAADQFHWGQRWEHTNSAYLPYPGASRPEGGESGGKFMINTMVLRGASVVTPPNHSRKTYRNFSHPQVRWQFNGIRLCKD